ncbi:MAG: glycosyltransferase [Candidatus Hydrogenedentales bacterium]
MKLEIFTIALDAMPFITWHLPVFNRLKLDWHWTIAEGAAMNTHCTSWCKPQPPHNSRDGTLKYLAEIKAFHPRITLLSSSAWDGKVSQCNACLSHISEPCILLQMDADEIWTRQQLESLVAFFEAHREINCARFFCRYFVGQSLITVGEDCYGNNPGEWLRAWRFYPGQKFERHEGPALAGVRESSATREQTRGCDLVFDHYAYAFEEQVRFKQDFYNYPDAVNHWLGLQRHNQFPCKLKPFLPWVDDRVVVDRLF